MFEEALRALRRAVWSGGREGRAWIAGEDEEGQVVVQVESPAGAYTLRLPDARLVDALVGPPLKEIRTSLPLPYRPRTARPLPVAAAPVAASVMLVRAGEAAQRMSAVDRIDGDRLCLAGYTCRGPTKADQGLDYKPYNEDGMLLHWMQRDDGSEIAILGAFDQAGGEGRVDDRHGAASQAAAQAIESFAHRFAAEDPPTVLAEAVAAADDAVNALEVGAVSTLAVAVVVTRPDHSAVAHVATVGDSRVVHLGPAGGLQNASVLHNLGAQVAVGKADGIHPAFALQFAGGLSRGLGGEDARPEIASWVLAPGDRLVVASDGLGDARELEEMPLGTWHADLCSEHVAQIAAAAADPAEAVHALVGYALDQAAEGYGKPDNIAVTVLALRP